MWPIGADRTYWGNDECAYLKERNVAIILQRIPAESEEIQYRETTPASVARNITRKGPFSFSLPSKSGKATEGRGSCPASLSPLHIQNNYFVKINHLSLIFPNDSSDRLGPPCYCSAAIIYLLTRSCENLGPLCYFRQVQLPSPLLPPVCTPLLGSTFASV